MDRSPGLLLVDDEEIILEAFGEMLRRKGYRVETAEDGVSALKILEQNADSIDLVMSDMSMPSFDGLELLRRVRQQRQWSNTTWTPMASSPKVSSLTVLEFCGCCRRMTRTTTSEFRPLR